MSETTSLDHSQGYNQGWGSGGVLSGSGTGPELRENPDPVQTLRKLDSDRQYNRYINSANPYPTYHLVTGSATLATVRFKYKTNEKIRRHFTVKNQGKFM